MNNILEKLKDRNMSVSLSDVRFFMAYDREDCLIVPVLINNDLTKAKDLRTSRIYDIKENKNGSKDMWGLFLSVMKKYDKNIERFWDIDTNVRNFPKKFYMQEIYTYKQFFHDFYKKPYNEMSTTGTPIGYSSKFFNKYHILLSNNFITTKKEIVKLCDDCQAKKQKVLKKEIKLHTIKSESQKNREF